MGGPFNLILKNFIFLRLKAKIWNFWGFFNLYVRLFTNFAFILYQSLISVKISILKGIK